MFNERQSPAGAFDDGVLQCRVVWKLRDHALDEVHDSGYRFGFLVKTGFKETVKLACRIDEEVGHDLDVGLEEFTGPRTPLT
jgi:hypothetical protein